MIVWPPKISLTIFTGTFVIRCKTIIFLTGFRNT
jgi:hypothetical protein